MKLVRRLLIILCLLFTISGLVAGLYINAIQRALEFPANRSRMPSTISAIVMTPSQTPTPSARLSPPAAIANILAQDTFHRPDQALWGTASDGRVWEGDAGTHPNNFFISGNMGIIMHAQSTLNAILGPTSRNSEVLASGSVSHFGGTINFGVVVRWTDSNDWYKAFIDGRQFVVLKRVKGVTTTLGAQPFPAQGNTLYTLRLRVIGAVLLAKVWPSAKPEPTGWMVNVTDTSLTFGKGGVRVLVQNDVIVKVASFFEGSATSQV
jgi:hypothetical protein